MGFFSRRDCLVGQFCTQYRPRLFPHHPHKKSNKKGKSTTSFFKQGVASYCTSGAAVEQAVQRFLSSFCPAVQVRRSCSSTRSELTCGLHHRRRCHFAIIVCDFSPDTGGPSPPLQ